MTHERSYKEAWTAEAALAEIIDQRGKHFDPQVVDAFVELFQEIDLPKVMDESVWPS